MDGAFNQVRDGSSSSVDDPLELDRIRQWMDHQDWDMLDEPAELPLSGMELLELANQDIEKLSHEHPANIEYLNAFAAAKLALAQRILYSNPSRCVHLTTEAVSISEELWSNHPESPILVKHAIRGLARIARIKLNESKNDMALKTCDRAIQLFNKAWAPIQDEIWVMDDFCPLLEVQVDVLNASKKLEQALAVLDEFETFAATLRVKFPLHVGRLVTLIYIGLKRHSVLVQMGNEPAALEVENHLRSVVETSKGEIGFKDALRHVAKGTPLPESIQRLLVE